MFFYFSNIAAVSKLCAAGTVYGNKEDTVAHTKARDQVMLESKQRLIMQLTVKEDVAQ